jgi:hypothetical protein
MEGNKSLLNSSGNGKSHNSGPHNSGFAPNMASGISELKPKALGDLKFASDVNNNALPQSPSSFIHVDERTRVG